MMLLLSNGGLDIVSRERTCGGCPSLFECLLQVLRLVSLSSGGRLIVHFSLLELLCSSNLVQNVCVQVRSRGHRVTSGWDHLLLLLLLYQYLLRLISPLKW